MAEMIDHEDRQDNGRRAGKSPDAFRTISEVATELEVPQHVLRFWESKFTQVKPLKRGGGRRYYRPEDVDLLRGIRRLLYADGYTIKGVQKLLRENGVRSVMEAGRRLAGEPAPAAPAEPADPGEEAFAAPAAAELGNAPPLSSSDRRRIAIVLRELTRLKQMLDSVRR